MLLVLALTEGAGKHVKLWEANKCHHVKSARERQAHGVEYQQSALPASVSFVYSKHLPKDATNNVEEASHDVPNVLDTPG
eukprot:m.4604 g.4604  ORF g.4604 m.4604 type:complete len:80 (+) comp7063_c0_seq1:350-589(+)